MLGFPLEQFELAIMFTQKIIENIYFVFDTQAVIILSFLGFIGFVVIFTLNSKGEDRSNIYNFLVQTFNFIKGLTTVYVKKGLEYTNTIMVSIFFFILIANLLGLIPGSYCITAQFIITFFLSALVFFACVFLSAYWGGKDFLLHFIPGNVPGFLKPFLAIIEVISFISRLFSLAIRLFANLVAGHSLLHILAESNIKIGKSLGVTDILLLFLLLFPLVLTIAIYGLETGIAFLQAYVFVVLSLIYLREVEVFQSGHY